MQHFPTSSTDNRWDVQSVGFRSASWQHSLFRSGERHEVGFVADYTVEPLWLRSALRPFGKGMLSLKRISGEVFGSVTNSPLCPCCWAREEGKEFLNVCWICLRHVTCAKWHVKLRKWHGIWLANVTKVWTDDFISHGSVAYCLLWWRTPNQNTGWPNSFIWDFMQTTDCPKIHSVKIWKFDRIFFVSFQFVFSTAQRCFISVGFFGGSKPVWNYSRSLRQKNVIHFV